MFEFARHISKLFFDSNSFLSYFIFFASLFSMLNEPRIFHKENADTLLNLDSFS